MREQWRETSAVIRQDRQITRRIKERITGLAEPTRKQFRQASNAIGDERAELEDIERRVVDEHEREQQEDGDR